MKSELKEQKALLFAEKHGIVEYHIKGVKMIFQVSYPIERSTCNCSVDLRTMEETRTCLKRYYKKSIYNN